MGTPVLDPPVIGFWESSCTSTEQKLPQIMVIREDMLLIWTYGGALLIRTDGRRKRDGPFVSHSHHSAEVLVQS